MKLATTPEELKSWAQQWRRTAVVLDELKKQELRAMTEADAARIVMEMLPEPDYAELEKCPRPLTGLVEQQRIFRKLR